MERKFSVYAVYAVYTMFSPGSGILSFSVRKHSLLSPKHSSASASLLEPAADAWVLPND